MIYHKTEYRERRDHFALFRLLRTRRPVSTPHRDAFLGPYRGWDRPARRRTRLDLGNPLPTAGSRSAPTTSTWSLAAAGELKRSSSCSAMTRTRRTPSSIRPGRRRQQTTVRDSSPGTWIRPRRDRRSPRCAKLGRAARRFRSRPATSISTGWSTSGTPTSAWSRSTCPARPRCFESGIGRGMGFRDSNQDLLGFVHLVPERARAADPRPRRDPTAERRRVPPVPAADQARQRRGRLRFQRRSRCG